MIGQYLSNTNETATVSIFQKFLELNKALVHPWNQNFFKILCHIESCGTCMEH